MPNPENVIGKGNRFSSTNQPANKGRKKSVFNQLRDKVYAEEGLRLSREDCYKLCASLIELPVEELKTIYKDTTSPAWVVSIVGAILSDIKFGRMVTVDSLFDRFFGKATQPTDNKTEHTFKPRTLTPEEAREIGVNFFEEY